MSARLGAARLVIAALIVGAATACTSDQAEVMFVAGDSEPSIEGIPGLRVSFRAQDQERVVDADDFRRTADFRTLHTRAFRIGHEGELKIDARIIVGGDTVAHGTRDLAIRPSTLWTVGFIVSDRDPMGGCFCQGTEGFEIRGPDGAVLNEKLWIFWDLANVGDGVF